MMGIFFNAIGKAGELLLKSLSLLGSSMVAIVRLPLVAVSFLREILTVLALCLVCMGVYHSVPTVRDKVDPIVERSSEVVEKHTPRVITKGVKYLGVKSGLLEKPRTTLQTIWIHLKKIPREILMFGKSLANVTFDKFLDLIFHPVVIVGVVSLLVKRRISLS